MRIKIDRVSAMVMLATVAWVAVLSARRQCSAWPGSTDGNCVLCDCIEVYGYDNAGPRGTCRLDMNNALETYEESAQEDIRIGQNGMTGYCRQKPAFNMARNISKVVPTNSEQICTGVVQGKFEIWWSQFNNVACAELQRACTNSAFFPGVQPVPGL